MMAFFHSHTLHFDEPCRTAHRCKGDDARDIREALAEHLADDSIVRNVAEIDNHLHHISESGTSLMEQGFHILPHPVSPRHNVADMYHFTMAVDAGSAGNEQMLPVAIRNLGTTFERYTVFICRIEMCQCLKDLCGKEQIKNLSSMLNLGSQSFDTFDLDYYSPVYDASIGSSPRNMMEYAQDVCFQFANRFPHGNQNNLFLTGNPGLGKTFLSAAIARLVSEKGYSVVYDSAVNVFNRFEAQKFGRDSQASQDIDRYLTCDLMILDDLGSEMNSPLVQSSLYQLINGRMLSERSTVISSNFSLDEIAHRYSSQVYSRLSGEYLTVRFFGEDIRKQKRARGIR